MASVDGQLPENINNGAETAPSKRILRAVPNYDKRNIGTMIAVQIGMENLCLHCEHFRAWIQQIEAL